VDLTSFNEFKITGIENNFGSAIGSENFFEASINEESLTAQRRRSYLMEMNEDFDIQQDFKEVTWNQRVSE
jgi:hypothetical protein